MPTLSPVATARRLPSPRLLAAALLAPLLVTAVLALALADGTSAGAGAGAAPAQAALRSDRDPEGPGARPAAAAYPDESAVAAALGR